MIKSFKIEKFKHENKIIIYGAGLYGEYVYKCLQKNNISVNFFADRNEKIEKYMGVPVISPETIGMIDNPIILLASANYIEEMVKILEENGIENYYSVDDLIRTELSKDDLSEYAREVSNNLDKYLFSLKNLEEKKFLIKNIDLVITEFCNLNCRDCGSLIPYYKHPQHIALDEIIEPFNNFLNSIDSLYELRILGGEPFLYPDLDVLLEKYSAEKKIEKIVIYTNATMELNQKILSKMKNEKITLHISDYGKYSRKKEELVMTCKENGIHYYMHEYNEWRDMGNISKRNLTMEKVKGIYMTCDNANCPSFYRGRVYICPRAAHGESIGAFKNENGENVDFRSRLIDTNEKKKELYHMLREREIFTACYYCNGNSIHSPSIRAAVQI